jgi:hypothetical protein
MDNNSRELSKEEAFKMLKDNVYNVQSIDPFYLADGDFIRKAMKELGNKKDACILASFSSTDLKRKNKKICVLALAIGDPIEFSTLSEELQKDKNVLLSFARIPQKNGYILNFVDDEFRNDIEVMSEFVKKDGSAIFKAGEKIKNDKDKYYELVKAAVSSDGMVLRDLKEYQADKEVINMAISNNPFVLKSINNLQKDNDVYESYRHSVLTSRKYIREALLDEDNSFLTNRIKDDKVFAIKVVEKDHKYLKYLNSEFRDDFQIMRLAIDNDGYNLKFASRRLQKEESLLLLAYRRNRGTKDTDAVLEHIRNSYNQTQAFKTSLAELNQLKEEFRQEFLKNNTSDELFEDSFIEELKKKEELSLNISEGDNKMKNNQRL